jgi:3-phenylpropionate/trans-cinnamate dioxygenase ferredoxin reductase subunit
MQTQNRSSSQTAPASTSIEGTLRVSVVVTARGTRIECDFAVANHYHPVFERRIRVEHWHNAIKQSAVAARNMLGQHVAHDEVHWFWSDQYDVSLQYAGYHTSAEQIIVRGSLASDSFLVCYVNGGRIDAALAFNRGKDLRRVMPLIKSRRVVALDRLRDETVDVRSLVAA